MTMTAGESARHKDENAMDRALFGLRSAISTGLLSPGEQIRQEEMAQQFGVSRVPLREALNVLARQGLLVHRPHQGYFVAKRRPIELAQIFRMLSLLEAELMRSLAWPTPDQLARLRWLNEEMRRYVEAENWSPLLAHNTEFHFLIFGLSPYTLIFEEVQRVWTLAEPFLFNKHETAPARARTVAEHDAIIAALAAHDRAGCIAAMDSHRASSTVNLIDLTRLPAD